MKEQLWSHEQNCAQRHSGECTCGAFEHNERVYANETKATHTPGPWEIGGPDDAYIFAGSGSQTKRIAEIVEDDLDSEYDYCSTDEADANAQLIAAAPDLLARLRECVDYLYAEADNAEDRNNGLIAECETAIRKATGGDGAGGDE